MSKITVIGAGSVGATIANDLMIQGTASEIVLVDINKQKAFGEALDIYQGAPFCSPAIVRSGDYQAAANSDIVIITSGLPRKPGQTRLELAQVNVNILKDITPQIVRVAPKAIYILVSNPVDVLTYVFHKISGLPEHQIIGSGTILPDGETEAEIVAAFLSPESIGKGYGRKLFETLETDELAAKATRVWLTSSDMALGFYEHMGWVNPNGPRARAGEDNLLYMEKRK